jgi:hypothetical protein
MTLDPIRIAIHVGLITGLASSVIVISVTALIGEALGHNDWSSWWGAQMMADSTAVALIALAVCVLLISRQLMILNDRPAGLR